MQAISLRSNPDLQRWLNGNKKEKPMREYMMAFAATMAVLVSMPAIADDEGGTTVTIKTKEGNEKAVTTFAARYLAESLGSGWIGDRPSRKEQAIFLRLRYSEEGVRIDRLLKLPFSEIRTITVSHEPRRVSIVKTNGNALTISEVADFPKRPYHMEQTENKTVETVEYRKPKYSWDRNDVFCRGWATAKLIAVAHPLGGNEIQAAAISSAVSEDPLQEVSSPHRRAMMTLDCFTGTVRTRSGHLAAAEIKLEDISRIDFRENQPTTDSTLSTEGAPSVEK
jgi:hypothetical protein